MTVIKVPKPPRSAYDPNRPVSSLLKMQVEHLSEAEKRLPLRYRSEIYVNAIKTEGDAAEYIRQVTMGIHAAHADAAVRRAKPAKKRKGVIEIAAVADERAERKLRGRSSAKKSNKKKKR
jgi:hypothetical protein